MGLLELIKNNMVLIGVVLFFLLMALRGYKKGFLHMVASFGGVLAAVAIAKVLMPLLTARLLQNNSWVNFVTLKILPKLKVVTLEQVMSAIAFLIVFLITLLVIALLVSALGKLTEGALIGFIDRTLGIALGMCEALIYTWVFMLFVDVMPQLQFCQTALEQITANKYLSLLHDNNLLITFLQGVLK